jgi:regulator of protease activity HflC (stomatin/prohibitin superfamily)
MNYQTNKEQVDVSAASKDLQTVRAVVALNYNLMPDKVGQLYSEIGSEYKSKLIDPAIQEAVKAATARYDASELVTKRELVKEEIKELLIKRLSAVYIQASEVSIVNFDFSPEFNTAIEAKVTAEQSALQAKNKLEQIKFEAEQTIATARAESESIRLKSDAANNEKYVALQRIEVQRAFAQKWNGQLPVNMYGSAPLPFLQLEK